MASTQNMDKGLFVDFYRSIDSFSTEQHTKTRVKQLSMKVVRVRFELIDALTIDFKKISDLFKNNILRYGTKY